MAQAMGFMESSSVGEFLEKPISETQSQSHLALFPAMKQS